MNELYPKTVLTTTKFVLWHSEKCTEIYGNPFKWGTKDYAKILDNISKYAELMQAPLSLEMFVPCKDGELIKYPKIDKVPSQINVNLTTPTKELLEYQQAKEKVLFNKIYTPFNNKIGINQRWYSFSKRGLPNKENAIFIEVEKAIIVNIEDLARQIELIPTTNFWEQIFK